MSAYYKVQILSVSGILLAEIDNYRELGYTNMVNSPGACEIVLAGNNPKIQYIDIGHQLEVYRINRQYGIDDWQRDFVGFIRKIERSTNRGEDTFILTAVGINELLDRRANLHYADTTDRSIFTNLPIETVMKRIVHTNVGNAAITASGRLRNGVIPNFTIASDQARGATIAWANAWKPILSDLQEIAETYQYDFNVSKTGAYNWEFEVYPNQLGTDRRTEVYFAIENGNMTDPSYTYDALNEKTIAFAAGEGEKILRQTVTVSGLYYSPQNDREVYVDARNTQSSITALEASAKSRLAETVPQEQFSFTVLQTFSTYYGKHYFLGDIVTAQYKGRTFIQKIEQISVQYDRANLERIRVTMKTL